MTSSTPVVRIDDVSKRFVIRKDKSLKERLVNYSRSREHREEFWALKNISVDINSGDTVGLIGPNGSGKSTLLKTIGGILQPTSGLVTLRGRLAALVELGAGFHPDLTGRENVYLNAAILGLSRTETERCFDEIVEFSGIEEFIDTQVKFYSSGMYVRLAFAVAINVDPDILLVDEVLAVGDEPFQAKCMEKIKQFQFEGRTIVLVTHSLVQIGELCDRAIVLEHGNIVADDEPAVALRVLRQGFETSRQEDLESATLRLRSDGSEVPTATVESLTLVGGEEKSGTGIITTAGNGFGLQIKINAEERLTNWVLGIRIDTPMGQNIWGTNSDMMKFELPSFVGKREFVFELSDIPLGPGQYTVYGSVRLDDGTLLDRKDTGPVLTVNGDGRSTGYLSIPTKISEVS